MPPTTTPTRTMIVSCRAKSGVTNGCCTVIITATTAASRPERRTENAITRFARTPSRRAVRKSLAAARVWRPIVVRVSSRTSSSSAAAATPIETSVIFRMSVPPIVTASFSELSDGATWPIVPSRTSTISATAWSMNAIANVVTSITAGDAPRSGRKTTVSIASDSATTTATQVRMLVQVGQLDV